MKKKNITLKQLEYFLAISETENLTQAAEILNITQPPLSIQLKKLEQELDTQLFKRTKKGMVITDAGILLRDRATQILTLVNETHRSLEPLDPQYVGEIRIGAITSACYVLIPKLVKKFLKYYPNTSFIIKEDTPENINEFVNNRVLDFGFIRRYAYSTKCRSFEIPKFFYECKKDEMIAVGIPYFLNDIASDSIYLSDIKEKPLIIFKSLNTLIKGYQVDTEIKLNILSIIDNPISAISWAINGLGIAIIPRSFLFFQDRECNIELIKKTLVRPAIDPSLILITDRRKDHPFLVSRFLQIINKEGKEFG